MRSGPQRASKRQLCRQDGLLCALPDVRCACPFRSTRVLAAAVVLVDGRPGAPLGFFLGDTELFIAFGDVVSALRSCLSVYLDLSPRGMAQPLSLRL
jgi:hypothetical protein